ncbi:MAG: peptide chain release factor N(5)-glutamine methyltransferase [Planctomycetes bacterium]|nr:peptide chain release factor N(5)-glutamine methyltransferase [Planctomycetota bacterium]
MPTTVLEVLRKTTEYFAARGLDSPRLDAEVLLAHRLGCRRLDLYLQHDRPLAEPELVPLRDAVRERGRGVPVAYLTGTKEFYALPFAVTRDVLVPRPETEGVVEAAVEALADAASPVVADVGTGSGCIAVALLVERPDARALAGDVSAPALAVARANAARHGVADRLETREGAGLSPWRDHAAWGRLAAVVSNPPYIVRGDPTVEPGVAAHEPALALYVDGDDPLAVAAAVATQACEALAPGGFLAVEVGAGSGAAAHTLLERLGYVGVVVRPDGAGIPRVACGRRPG